MTQVMYFLPKVHKNLLKVRPIVSCSGGPASRASDYIDSLLQPHMVKTEPYVRNSTDVIHRLKELDLPAASMLAILDIKSLYTNISHHLVIESFHGRFTCSSHPRFVFLLDLLKFGLTCMNNTFQFDGRSVALQWVLSWPRPLPL